MKRFAALCDRFVSLGVGALIVLTPLAFGSFETWAIVILESAIFLIAAAWLMGRALDGRARKWTGLEVPILLFVGVVLVQMIPLSRGVLSVVSPRAAALYERTVPGFAHGAPDRFEDWLLASDGKGNVPAPAVGGAAQPISYAVPETRDRISLFAAFALIFLVVADRYRDPGRLRRLVIAIVFVGVGIAIQGVFQKLTWNGKVLWLRAPDPTSHPFGPFVNPNHFAGYMELIVPLALGLLLTLLVRRSPVEPPRSPSRIPLAEANELETREPEFELYGYVEESVRPARAWTATSSRAKAVLLGFLIAFSIGSIVLSLSRGGFVATLLTFLIFSRVLVAPVVRGEGRGGRLAAIIAVSIVVLGIVYWLGASAIAERAATLSEIQTESSATDRVAVWKQTIEMFRDHPVLGTGLGTFYVAFGGYYPPSSLGAWAQAHNDYLQLLGEVGVVGLVPALLALFVFGVRWFLPALRHKDRPDRYLLIGLAMAIVSLLLHSVVDFNLQIPAIGFLFVVIGALLVASGSATEDAPVGITPSPSWRGVRVLGAALLLGCSCVLGYFGSRRVESEMLAKKALSEKDSLKALDMFEEAWKRAPALPGAALGVGDQAMNTFSDQYLRVLPRLEEGRAVLRRAERAYRQLVVMVPNDASGWWGLGEYYMRLRGIDRMEGPIDLERLEPASEKDLARTSRVALGAFRTAILLEPNSFQVYDAMAKLLLQEGMRSAAMDTYRRSAFLMPVVDHHRVGRASDLPADVSRAFSDGIRGALAAGSGGERAALHKELGQLAYLRGDLPTAAQEYELGLKAARTESMAGIMAFVLGIVKKEQGKLPEAIGYLERATKNPFVGYLAWIQLGTMREERGDHLGSLQAFSLAAALAPTEIEPALLVARQTARCGKREDAAGQLRYLIGANPDVLHARAILVQILREDHKLREALTEIEALVALDPSSAEYRRLAVEVRREAGVAPEAATKQ